ncbi:hypothetical protein CYLTODRAFT_400012 [Cylindrobasidium torrendii FP15055 ss-10]|uniref:MYND-type domain-containing protein n=1 Tax=Cylindrobasidium torrendii FP15055 ss-10 TaxID=1314674 RepID=A0A0D7B6B7_9AGAR|nr:hypothetical protein CYLTODRAFT_400012 [Cylindrobasidium torrendii FP15055 ss-10]
MAPAFSYALLRLDGTWLPLPWKLSEADATSRMNLWNGLVDEYLDRTFHQEGARFLFEKEAKIGLHGGPLFRHCESPGCGNVKDRDVDSLQKCSSCKLIIYCSQECQKRGWKSHKAECKSRTHRPQRLKSQELLEDVMKMRNPSSGMKFTEEDRKGI